MDLWWTFVLQSHRDLTVLNEDKGLLGKAQAASELRLAESKLRVGPSCISLSNYSK
jgi:hypothetical protein